MGARPLLGHFLCMRGVFMDVCADLVEEFSASLTELQDVLLVKVPQNDPFYASLVQDARLFSFVRTSQVLRSVIRSLQDEEHEEFYNGDTESAIYSLCLLDMLTEDQAETLLRQVALEEFFLLDQPWLDSEEDLRTFESGLHELPLFFRTMNQFLDRISTDCTLRARDEVLDECH